MAARPAWAEQSDIWNSVSEVNDDRKLRSFQIADQANGAKTDHQPLFCADRRIALQVYEVYVGGPYPRLEVYAFEQLVSRSAEKNVIASNQIGSCVAQIFNREHALNNCFSISAQTTGYQTRDFLNCVYDEQASPSPPALQNEPKHPLTTVSPPSSTGTILSAPADLAPGAFSFDSDASYLDDATALSSNDLVSEHSFVFLEGIRVDATNRHRDIASALLVALLAEARLILPAIRFAASWPCASDADLSDARRVTSGDGGSSSEDGDATGGCRARSGLGQKRAEAFHRAAGFRRLGLTRFWAKRLEE